MECWLLIVGAASASTTIGINWTQTLVTAGLGGALALVGTGLTLLATERREQRGYIRNQQQQRIERFRATYVSAAELVTRAGFQRVVFSVVDENVATADKVEDMLKKLYQDELITTRFRLALLPAPSDIVEVYEQIYSILSKIGLENDDRTAEEKQFGEKIRGLTAKMTDHLEMLEQEAASGKMLKRAS